MKIALQFLGTILALVVMTAVALAFAKGLELLCDDVIRIVAPEAASQPSNPPRKP